MFWRGGDDEGSVVFQMPVGRRPCDLEYRPGLGKIEFRFAGGS